MAKFTVSASDMARGLPAPDGWYKAKLVQFDVTADKSKTGLLYVPTVEFEDKKKIDRRIKTWFSSKGINLKWAKFYHAALGQKLDPTTDFEVDTDLVKIGTEMWIKVVTDTWEGGLVNKVDDWASADEEVPY